MGMTTQERSARYHAKKRAEWIVVHGEPKRVGGNRKSQTFKQCSKCGQRFGPVSRLDVTYCSLACKNDALRGKPNGKRGRKYPELQRADIRACLSCGQEFRAVKDHYRRKQIYCNHTCYLRNRRQSSFEDRVAETLCAAGIPIGRQARRGRWSFDFEVIGHFILIEADGHYWHSSPKVQARDAMKDQWCSDHGLELYRVKELVFYEDPIRAMSVIITRWEAATGKTAERMIKADPQYQVAGNARPTG